ncbi:MAG: addiction module protein [Pyrinomonadaceae bacterium]
MATEFQIEQMTLPEKLRMMEALWDDLCRQDAVPMPKWHKDILDERRRLIDEGKARFIEWETAKSQIRERTS